MQRNLVDFLIKGRAIDYWKKQRWLQDTGMTYRLTEKGLAICAKAPATADPHPAPPTSAIGKRSFTKMLHSGAKKPFACRSPQNRHRLRRRKVLSFAAYLAQHAIDPLMPTLRGEWRRLRATCAEELARHEQTTGPRHSAVCGLQPRS